MKTKKKIDPFTGEEFAPKRSNQKFANRENQIAYNNLLAQQKREIKRPLDQILDKNHKVLMNLFDQDKDKIFSKDYLLGAGYSLGAYTYTAKEGNSLFYWVYNMAITPVEKDRFKIIRK